MSYIKGLVARPDSMKITGKPLDWKLAGEEKATDYQEITEYAVLGNNCLIRFRTTVRHQSGQTTCNDSYLLAPRDAIDLFQEPEEPEPAGLITEEVSLEVEPAEYPANDQNDEPVEGESKKKSLFSGPWGPTRKDREG